MRRIIGITGPPGVGKSTFAERLAAEGGGVQLPMDGFHLADATLRRLGLLDRKGAPETFDAWGYAALLARLRGEPPEVVYAPGFERGLEQPVAGVVAVPPDVGLVVTEGNYLLVDLPEWRAVRARLDEVWFLRCDEEVRRSRLVARHIAFGKTPEDAERWVARVDDTNAALVAATAGRADRIIEV